MGKRIDMTGKVFGKLTVIKLDSIKETGYQSSIAMWLARCECGSEKVYQGGNLRNGNATQCNECRLNDLRNGRGKAKPAYPKNLKRRIDLTGKVYGKLTVLRLGETKRYKKPNGSTQPVLMWVVRCECGNETSVQGNGLRNGSVSQCNECRLNDLRNNKYKKGKKRPAE